MVEVVLSVVGVVLLAVTFWWRRRPGSGHRWWSTGGRRESAALVAVPGLGLALALVWPAAQLTEGSAWYVRAAVPLVIGVVAVLWTLVGVRTPDALQPAWRRAQVLAQKRAEQRARRRQQAQRPAARGRSGGPSGGPRRGR
ncbi:MAG: hypothetical protein H5T83_04785 [Actinotalea sp.]|nr:hypothetical protein [Actinotalea sp.]